MGGGSYGGSYKGFCSSPGREEPKGPGGEGVGRGTCGCPETSRKWDRISDGDRDRVIRAERNDSNSEVEVGTPVWQHGVWSWLVEGQGTGCFEVAARSRDVFDCQRRRFHAEF